MKSKVLNHFKKVDPILFSIAKKSEFQELKKRQLKDYFSSICREIIGQQLSGKVARIIFSRFQDLFTNKKVNAETTLKFSEEKLRNVGMAWSKARAIKDLAQKTTDGTVNFRKINKLSDDQVAEELMKVKGIGPWTAEMFLMFTLGREDVFSIKDLGLRKAIKNIYNSDKIEMISSKWSPYRTYACFVLWKTLS